MKNIELTANYRIYQAFWIFSAYGSGIILGYIFLTQLNIVYLIIGTIALFLISLILYTAGRSSFIYFALMLVLLGGITRIVSDMEIFAEKHLLSKNAAEQPLAVKGWISEAHYREDGKHRYVLNCERIRRDSVFEEAQGKVLLLQGKYGNKLRYGENIETVLNISLPSLPRNPGEFNYRRYLQMKNIYFQARLPEKVIVLDVKGNFVKRNLLIPVRMKILSAINRYVSNPANSIMKAILLGEKQDIDKGILNDFQKTGVIHVLAISGLHVGIILAIFLLLFSILGFSYNRKVMLSLILLVIYMALVDFRASVVRATLMAIFYYSAQFMQRKARPINILAAAGLLILLIDPRQLFSMGFQFSFASVFSILYGYPRLKALWPYNAENKQWKYWFNKWLRQPFLVSFSAVLGIAPLTWYYFGTFQIGAVVANLFIIPLFALFLSLSFIFLALAIPALPGAAGLAFMANSLMIFIISLINKFSQLSFIQVYMHHPSSLVIILFSLLILLLYNISKKRYLPYILLFTLLFAYLLIRDNYEFNKGKLRITYADVGQGDGAVINLPNGENIVIDGGIRQFKKDAGRRFMLPLLHYYGVHHIKYLIGSHSHSDHIGGLIAILQNIKTDTLVLSGYAAKTKLYEQLLNTAKSRNVTLLFKHKGDQLYAGEKLRIYILHPDSLHLIARSYSGNEVNNSSLVIKICYGKTAFLFTGDLEQNAEDDVIAYNSFLKSDVLKVGHHGSKTSTSLSFLKLVHPVYSLVSVGKGNKFYHPSRKTIQRLRENNARPLRTDHFGALVFESDGKNVALLNWRK
jgi:competence protein ComEC